MGVKLMKTEQQIVSSLLHRLVDEHPEFEHETDAHKYISLEALKKDIRENLEMILNTRLGYFDAPKGCDEIKRSILNYGIPDFTRQYYSLRQNQQELCNTIKATINHFESRLQQVKVTLSETDAEINRSFFIRIESVINIKPEPKQAVFESNLDIVRYQFSFDEEKS